MWEEWIVNIGEAARIWRKFALPWTVARFH